MNSFFVFVVTRGRRFKAGERGGKDTRSSCFSCFLILSSLSPFFICQGDDERFRWEFWLGTDGTGRDGVGSWSGIDRGGAPRSAPSPFSFVFFFLHFSVTLSRASSVYVLYYWFCHGCFIYPHRFPLLRWSSQRRTLGFSSFFVSSPQCWAISHGSFWLCIWTWTLDGLAGACKTGLEYPRSLGGRRNNLDRQRAGWMDGWMEAQAHACLRRLGR